MTTDDKIERYLRERAPRIELPEPVAGAVGARARQRRRRRGAATAVAAAVVLVGGAVGLGQGLGGGDDVADFATEPVDATLEWTTVVPEAGIGWGSAPAVTDSGSVYRLSTAPGDLGDRPVAEPKTLYRSADGTDWELQALPDRLWASDLAARGDHLYVVGTAPAGGDLSTVELARHDGDGWAIEQLPFDVAALAGSVPADRLVVRSPDVAVLGDTTVVAVDVSLQLEPFVEEAFPEAAASERGWSTTEEGIELLPTCAARVERSDGDGPADPADDLSAEEADRLAEAEAMGLPDCPDGGAGAEAEAHSWSELGLDEASIDLARGETLLYAATGDGSFEEVGPVSPGLSESRLVAGDDAVWLVRTDYAEREVLAVPSVDGRTWEQAGAVRHEGWVFESGALDGVPAIAVIGAEGRLALVRLLAAGPEVVDVDAIAAGLSGWTPAAHLSEPAFGPLGVAAVLADEGTGRRLVAFSPDGHTWSVQELPAAPEGRREAVNGLTVTADAVKVRLNGYLPDDLSGTDAEQRLFVGTPAE